MNLKNIFKNSVFAFTAIRYGSYILLFLRGFILAKFLGPYYFGIWGLLTMVLQYLSFSGLGIQYSLNNELALRLDHDNKIKAQLISSALISTVMISLFIYILWLILAAFQIQISMLDDVVSIKMLAILILIATMQNLQQVFTNIFRVYNRLKIIAISEMVVAIITLGVAFLFKDVFLIKAFFLSWLLALLTINGIYFIVLSGLVNLSISKKYLWLLLKDGFPLLVYNFSSYLLVLAVRTIVSIYYPLEELGYYTLANSITTAVLLGLDSIAWVFVPKLIYKMKEGADDIEVMDYLNKVNNVYGTAVFVLVFMVALMSPLIFLYLPAYTPVGSVLIVLLVTQGINAFNYGFISLIGSRKKYYTMVFISLLGVGVSTGISLIFTYFNFNFYWMAVAIFIGIFLISVLVAYYAIVHILNKKFIFFQIYSPSVLIPVFLFIIGSMTNYSYILYGIGVAIFLIFNYNKIRGVQNFILSKI